MVAVGHAADHAVSISFCESNRRCAMVVQWTAACACGVGLWVMGFVGFLSVGG